MELQAEVCIDILLGCSSIERRRSTNARLRRARQSYHISALTNRLTRIAHFGHICKSLTDLLPARI
jgi:hypothetical protein